MTSSATSAVPVPTTPHWVIETHRQSDSEPVQCLQDKRTLSMGKQLWERAVSHAPMYPESPPGSARHTTSDEISAISKRRAKWRLYWTPDLSRQSKYATNFTSSSICWFFYLAAGLATLPHHSARDPPKSIRIFTFRPVLAQLYEMVASLYDQALHGDQVRDGFIHSL